MQCRHCDKEFFAKDKRTLFCSRSCSSSFNNAGRKRTYESRLRTSISLRAVLPSEKLCECCGNNFTTKTNKNTARYCSRSCWAAANPRPSQAKAGARRGGSRQRSGRSKYGYFQNIWCQSTYEMAFVWSALRDGKNVCRNFASFEYVNTAGERRRYYPDFIVDGRYVEVKGWINEDVLLKIGAVPHEIDLIHGDRILKIVQEAKEHFGVSDLASIYAENPRPSKGTVICANCDIVFEKRTEGSIFCSRRCAGSFRAKQRMVDRRGNAPLSSG